MRTILRAWMALAALCLLAGPALAADNVAVTPGSGKTMACKDISTVCFTQHIVTDTAGNAVLNQNVSTSITPTIQALPYASGNCMGGFQNTTLAGARLSGMLNQLHVASKGGGTTALQVYVFASNPSSSTCTDKSTFTLNAADVSKLLTTFQITPGTITGTSVTEAEVALGKSYTTTDGKLYFAIVSGGAWTPASTTDLVINIGVIED